MRNNLFIKLVSIIIIFLFAIVFVIKFAGPSVLKLYIKTGIGNCQKIPILCMAPLEAIISAEINEEFLAELTQYKFPKMSISAPKDFSIVQEQIKKVYYKKTRTVQDESIIYVDCQEPNFLISLFPNLKKEGIKNDFELMKRTMFSKIDNIKNLNDAFFVILKSIFTPDLADQNNVQMIQAGIADKKCFINYNISGPGNYFDCNVFNNKGSFFKIYIKDKGAKLDINKALTIISTATETARK